LIRFSKNILKVSPAKIRKTKGKKDSVSPFLWITAGVIKFNENHNLVFKVENAQFAFRS